MLSLLCLCLGNQSYKKGITGLILKQTMQIKPPMRIEEFPQKQGTNLTYLPVPSTVLTEERSQKCVEQI